MSTRKEKDTQVVEKNVGSLSGRNFLPDVDIVNGKEEIRLLADLPGVNEKSVDITRENRILTITGRVWPPGFKGYRQVYGEFKTGNFTRSFTITDDIDQDNIVARVKNGVLRLILLKREQVSRKIEVKAA